MGKIRELDGLRGVLAVWVVGVHLLYSVGVSPGTFGFFAPVIGAHLRVQIFCILSGFVIFLMLERCPQGFIGFITGRLRRLYPAYLLAFILSVLMVDIALEATVNSPFSGARQESRVALLTDSQTNMPAHILAHLSLLHGLIPEDLLPNAAYAFLGQAWNISTEFQFYLLAPLLFMGLACGPVLRRAAFLVLCAGGWWAFRHWPNPADLAQYSPWFALGIVSYGLWGKRWPDLNEWVIIGSALAIFGFVSMAVGIWVLLFGWLLIRRDQGRGDRYLAWLRWPMLQWLGQISYSLYLLHMIPLYLGMYLLNGLGLDRLSYLLALSGLTFAGALPMAWLSATWIEASFSTPRARPRVGQEVAPPSAGG